MKINIVAAVYVKSGKVCVCVASICICVWSVSVECVCVGKVQIVCIEPVQKNVLVPDLVLLFLPLFN